MISAVGRVCSTLFKKKKKKLYVPPFYYVAFFPDQFSPVCLCHEDLCFNFMYLYVSFISSLKH